MSYELLIRPEAESDMLQAHAWYEDRRPGLGAQFLRAIESCLETIQRYPLACAKVEDDVRRALLKRFPYGIFYVVDGERISILACLHAKRRPGIWRRRL
jgi:toxin ParE1/3/4